VAGEFGVGGVGVSAIAGDKKIASNRAAVATDNASFTTRHLAQRKSALRVLQAQER